MTQKKIALVTGGSRGLGKDMAISLAKRGVDVVLTYRSKKEEAENTVKEIAQLGQKAIALHLDMSEFASIDPFVQAVKDTLKTEWDVTAFDFLVNNAGMGATVPFLQVT